MTNTVAVTHIWAGFVLPVTPGSQYTEVFLDRKKEVSIREMPLYFAKNSLVV